MIPVGKKQKCEYNAENPLTENAIGYSRYIYAALESFPRHVTLIEHE